MAQQGKSVLLIDLDLRKPSVHQIFGRQKDEASGVVNVLVGNAKSSEAIITDTGQENLHLMLSGLKACLLYTSPSPRDQRGSRMPSSA